MDDIPPTYAVATERDVVSVFADYIRVTDVFTCSLVSKGWHDSFRIRLWKRPSDFWELGERSALGIIFGMSSYDRIADIIITDGFLSFRRCLAIASQECLGAVQDIVFDHIIPTVYTDLPATWFMHLMSQLPNITKASFSGLPILNTGCILIPSERQFERSLQSLTHLSLTHMHNIAPRAWIHLFRHLLPGVHVLDLSESHGINNVQVLQIVSQHLPRVRSLKMRKLQLSDSGIKAISHGFQLRMNSLDVSHNLLTDKAIQFLQDWCFMPPRYQTDRMSSDGYSVDGFIPFTRYGCEPDWVLSEVAYKTMRYAKASRNRNNSFSSPGLTQLYISGNKVSAAGIISLIKTTRLETLDYGDMYMPSLRDLDDICLSLSMYAFQNMQNLRFDYRLLVDNTDEGDSRIILSLDSLPHLTSLSLTCIPRIVQVQSTFQNLLSFAKSLCDKIEPGISNQAQIVSLEFVENQTMEHMLNDMTDSDMGRFNNETANDFSFFDEPDNSVNEKRKGYEQIIEITGEHIGAGWDVLEALKLWSRQNLDNGDCPRKSRLRLVYEHEYMILR